MAIPRGISQQIRRHGEEKIGWVRPKILKVDPTAECGQDLGGFDLSEHSGPAVVRHPFMRVANHRHPILYRPSPLVPPDKTCIKVGGRRRRGGAEACEPAAKPPTWPGMPDASRADGGELLGPSA